MKTSTMTFHMENTKLKYLSAIRRTIMADIESYAFDHNNTRIVKNTSKNNNDELLQRIGMFPVSRQFAYSIRVTNDGPVPIDVTSSDFKLYHTNSDEFYKYMVDANERGQQYKSECRKHIIGNSHISNTKYMNNSNATTNLLTKQVQKEFEQMVDRMKHTYQSKEQKIDKPGHDESSLFLQPYIHLVTLNAGETIDMYGFSSSGTPRDHVKWQSHTMFFRMCKYYPEMKLHWDEYIDRLVSNVSSVKTEEQYNSNKETIGKLLHKTDSYNDFCKELLTPERIQHLKKEIDGIIRNTCDSVYNGDVNSYSKHTRCVRCIDRISHLLELPVTELYEPELTDTYQVTIRTHTDINSIYGVWEQAKSIFSSRCQDRMDKMDTIMSSLTKHTTMKTGYTLRLEQCTYTIGEVISYELSKDKRLYLSSYKHRHPTDSFIEFIFVLSDAVSVNDMDETRCVIKEILMDAFRQAISTIETIPSIPSLEYGPVSVAE